MENIMTVHVDYGNVIKEIQMQQDEIDYMVNLIESLPEDGKMVEWGCGGSTCKWLETMKPTQKLISIEHQPSWHMRVTRAVKNHFGETPNFQFLHVAEQHGFEHGYANIIEEHPFGTAPYINPDADIWDSDIFFIDGIARATCAMVVLLMKTKPDAAIFIHDYAGREIWYEWATQFYRTEVVGTTLVRLYPK
jgi:hypothetical protein